MTRPSIEYHEGKWSMLVGGETSPMDAVISSMLNAKLARMVESQRPGRERRAAALAELAEMDGEMLP